MLLFTETPEGSKSKENREKKKNHRSLEKKKRSQNKVDTSSYRGHSLHLYVQHIRSTTVQDSSDEKNSDEKENWALQSTLGYNLLASVLAAVTIHV